MARRVTKKPTIVQTALRLFAEKGIRETTTKEIARSARMAEGTLYRHFRSKGELASVLFAESMDRFTTALREELEGVGGLRERIEALIRAFFHFAQENPLPYSFVMSGHQREFRHLPRGRFKPKDLFVEVIQQGMAAGEFRQMDPNLAAALVIGMCIRVQFFLEHGLIGLDSARTVEAVGEAVWRVLQSHEKGGNHAAPR